MTEIITNPVPRECTCLEDFHVAYLFKTLGAGLVPSTHTPELIGVVRRRELHWDDRALLIVSLAVDLSPEHEAEIRRFYTTKNEDYRTKLKIIKKQYQ